jgi:predicted kinase
MSKITVLIGISGAGKSSFTVPLLKDKNTIRVNRDDARLMLFGAKQSDHLYYERKDIRACEDLVSETIEDTVYNALNKGRDIVFDNTHLQKKVIDDIIFKFNHLADIELVFLDIDVKEAKQRVSMRTDTSWTIKTDYIDKQFNDYQKLKKAMHGERLFYPQTSTKVKFDTNLPATYIVDIDGTVALKGDRDIFDDSKLHLDIEIKEVGHIIRALHKDGFKIVFVSGRQDSCMGTTVKWLKDNNLWMTDSEIFMRRAKDQRNDSIVKEEIVLNNLVPNFNVVGVLDDRIGVTRNFHKLGMFVLNVNQNFVKF